MYADLLDASYRLAVAAGIGLLIGLQREFAHRKQLESDETEVLFAGVRTLTIVAILGFLSAAMSNWVGSQVPLGAMILVVGALVTVSYVASSRRGQHGLTSEISALVVFALGVFAYEGPLPIVAVAGVATAAVLASKKLSRGFVERLTETDLHAFLIFSVLALIALPLLPREGPSTEPFTALVPFRIGLMVVFISGVNFLGYVLTKVLDTRKGIGLAGLVGGLVSSTAVTLSLSRRSKVGSGIATYLAIGIVLSWAVMFVRMILEVTAVNPGLLRSVVLPLSSALVACVAYSFFLHTRGGNSEPADATVHRNPLDLRPAVTFGLLFACILLVVNAANMYFGDVGVYVSAALSGVADVDAITLSMSELARDSLESEVASRAITIAAISNTIVKASIVAVVGGREIRRIILPGVLLIVIAAAVSALL